MFGKLFVTIYILFLISGHTTIDGKKLHKIHNVWSGIPFSLVFSGIIYIPVWLFIKIWS